MADDKDEIRELLHLYCFCMDEGRFAELGALFAPDGVWSAPYRTATGPADITAWLTQSVPASPRRMHYVMNSIVTVDPVPKGAPAGVPAGTPAGAGATARSNYLVMVEGADGPVPSVCGTYADVLVRIGGVWRFRRRELIHAFKGEMRLRLG